MSEGYEFDCTGIVEVGMACRVDASATLNAGVSGRIEIGAGSNIKPGARIISYGGTIEISERVSIGENTVIYGHGDVRIGVGTAIGPLNFIGSQEHIQDKDELLRSTGEIIREVRIGSGVIVSASCVITAGVEIGDRAFIGAGSLVFHRIPKGVLAYGSPCRPVASIERNPLGGWQGKYIEPGENDEIPDR